MKRKEHLFVLVLVVLFTTAGTAAGPPFPTPSFPPAPPATHFVVVPSGDEQVSPVDTMARGQDIFQLNMDMADTQLSHRLIVASIENVERSINNTVWGQYAAQTQLMRRSIAFGVEMGPKESEVC